MKFFRYLFVLLGFIQPTYVLAEDAQDLERHQEREEQCQEGREQEDQSILQELEKKGVVTHERARSGNICNET